MKLIVSYNAFSDAFDSDLLPASLYLLLSESKCPIYWGKSCFVSDKLYCHHNPAPLAGDIRAKSGYEFEALQS